MPKTTRDTARIPIGAVVRRTGLSAHVLRAWERRYSVVTPRRTEGGARLYTHEDVLRLQLLRRLTEDGHSIGQLAALPSADLLALIEEETIETTSAPGVLASDPAAAYLIATLDAVQSLDGPRVHATLMRAVVALNSREFVSGVVSPLLSRIGELWVDESICPVHEHVLSVNLRRVLAWMIDSTPVYENAPVIVSTTPQHQRHELGAMLAGITASEERWRVAYLGADLPAEDIATGARLTGASIVALSIVYVRDKAALRKEVKKLRHLLPKGVVLVAGGAGTRSAKLEEAGAIVLPDLDALRTLLQSPRAERDA